MQAPKTISIHSSYYLVAIFAIFIGSQITEGIILVPYWQSLSAAEFYAYYSQFGPRIGRFYTILTIVAALIPILLSLYFIVVKSRAITYSITSALFSVLIIACFYIYFKDANDLFYQAMLGEEALKAELSIWCTWHWLRVALEFLALAFLILALKRHNQKELKV